MERFRFEISKIDKQLILNFETEDQAIIFQQLLLSVSKGELDYRFMSMNAPEENDGEDKS